MNGQLISERDKRDLWSSAFYGMLGTFLFFGMDCALAWKSWPLMLLVLTVFGRGVLAWLDYSEA